MGRDAIWGFEGSPKRANTAENCGAYHQLNMASKWGHRVEYGRAFFQR
jgi:hypothetical protein